jgi:HD-GYP domain-containing protein (c-di-GMP phosphodiesterase class II)
MDKSEVAKHREQLQQQHAERDWLKQLLKFQTELSSQSNIDTIARIICTEVKQVVQAERCSVFLIDTTSNELHTIFADGIEGDIRIPTDQGIVGAVYRTGKLINLMDAQKDKRFNRSFDIKFGYQTKSLLTVPMSCRKGKIIGVLQALNKKEGVFSRKDEQALTAIAEYSSLTIEKAQLYMQRGKSLTSFMETLASALDTRDYITAGHSRRVTLYALEIGRQMKLNKNEMEIIQYAGLLHDIGKIGVPEVVLFKDRKLNEDEFEMLKRHASLTKHLLSKIYFQDQFHHLPLIAASHHEKINGKGYPDGLIGDEIPLGGKILAVADVFDALTSRRPYKDRMELEEVMATIDRETGTSFEPFVVYNFKMMHLDRLILILEHGYGDEIREADLVSLRDYSLREIIEIRGNSNKNNTEIKVENIFMRYYLRHYRNAP